MSLKSKISVKLNLQQIGSYFKNLSSQYLISSKYFVPAKRDIIPHIIDLLEANNMRKFRIFRFLLRSHLNFISKNRFLITCKNDPALARRDVFWQPGSRFYKWIIPSIGGDSFPCNCIILAKQANIDIYSHAWKL